MFHNPILAGLGYIMFFLSYGLYYLGITGILFGLIGGVTLSDDVTFEYSFLDALAKLENSGKFLPYFIVFVFTYIVPLVKLLLGILCILQPLLLFFINGKRYQRYLNASKEDASPDDLEKAINDAGIIEKIFYFFTISLEPVLIIRLCSKFQFTDSFMAMIVLPLLVKTARVLQVMEGGFYFWGYCVMSLLSTEIISLSQYSVNPGMLFSISNVEYELEQSKPFDGEHAEMEIINFENGSPKSEPSVHKTNSQKLRTQIFFSFSYQILVAMILVFLYTFYFLTDTMLVELNLLDYRITLASLTMKGKEMLEFLNTSSYIINGYMSILLFAFVFPIIHMVGAFGIYIYFIYCFVTDKDYQESNEKNLTEAQLSHEDKFHHDNHKINFANLLKSFNSKVVNEYDLLLLKYINERKWLSTLIELFDHVGDWCMLEVYCIAMVAAYFTMNAIPNLEAHPPPEGVISHFYAMGPLMVVAFLMNNNYTTFANRIRKLESQDFKYYNSKFGYIPSYLAQTKNEDYELQETYIKSMINSTSNEDKTIVNTSKSHLPTVKQAGISESTKTHVKKPKRKVYIKTKAYLPFIYNVYAYIVVTIVAFIVGMFYTFTSFTAPYELTIVDTQDIIYNSIPYINRMLPTLLPYAMGNCDPDLTEIKPLNKEGYRPEWAITDRGYFRREINFEPISADEYDTSTCNPTSISHTLNFDYGEHCLTDIDESCGVIPQPFVGFALGDTVLSILKLTGLGTLWIDTVDVEVNNDGQIQFTIVVQLPDFKVDLFIYSQDTMEEDVATTELLMGLLGGDTHDLTVTAVLAFDCLEAEDGPLQDLHFLSLILKSDSLPESTTSLINTIVVPLLDPLVNTKFNLLGAEQDISGILNGIVKLVSNPPYTCPAVTVKNSGQ